MIIGVGVDVVEIGRIERAAGKAAFLRRVFTEGEVFLYEERGRNAAVLAGCFAGKEAAVKAMGTGFTGFWPSDIEILRHGSGKPVVRLYGKALEAAELLGIGAWHISITNTAGLAAAVVIAAGKR